jgi:hypothetical protein
MLNRSLLRPLIALAVGLVGAAPLTAQSPIQLALVTPVQLVPEGSEVRGLRIDFLYGTNTAVNGFDIGLVNRTTRGPSSGIQWGGVNMVEGAFTGWQSGFVSMTHGKVFGLQSGFVNLAESSEGVQWGGFNSSTNHNGLQLALINYAERIHGVQIGLVNIIKIGGAFPVFPIFNFGK